MKPAEFDQHFKERSQEFCQILRGIAQQKGFVLQNVDISKYRDYIFIFNCIVFQIGVRSPPRQHIYTVLYNPKTEKYTWHEGEPSTHNEREKVVN